MVAVAAVAITMTKIGRTRITAMPTVITSTPMTGMGGPHDWPCVHHSTLLESFLLHGGNCHAIIANPNDAAVLEVLFTPYNKDNDRECTC